MARSNARKALGFHVRRGVVEPPLAMLRERRGWNDARVTPLWTRLPGPGSQLAERSGDSNAGPRTFDPKSFELEPGLPHLILPRELARASRPARRESRSSGSIRPVLRIRGGALDSRGSWTSPVPDSSRADGVLGPPSSAPSLTVHETAQAPCPMRLKREGSAPRRHEPSGQGRTLRTVNVHC